MPTKREVLERAVTGENCLGRAAPEEPIFVLRAHDLDAPSCLRDWALRRVNRIVAGAKPLDDIESVREALEIADAMEHWQREEAAAGNVPTVCVLCHAIGTPLAVEKRHGLGFDLCCVCAIKIGDCQHVWISDNLADAGTECDACGVDADMLAVLEDRGIIAKRERAAEPAAETA